MKTDKFVYFSKLWYNVHAGNEQCATRYVTCGIVLARKPHVTYLVA